MNRKVVPLVVVGTVFAVLAFAIGLGAAFFLSPGSGSPAAAPAATSTVMAATDTPAAGITASCAVATTSAPPLVVGTPVSIVVDLTTSAPVNLVISYDLKVIRGDGLTSGSYPYDLTFDSAGSRVVEPWLLDSATLSPLASCGRLELTIEDAVASAGGAAAVATSTPAAPLPSPTPAPGKVLVITQIVWDYWYQGAPGVSVCIEAQGTNRLPTRSPIVCTRTDWLQVSGRWVTGVWFSGLELVDYFAYLQFPEDPHPTVEGCQAWPHLYTFAEVAAFAPGEPLTDAKVQIKCPKGVVGVAALPTATPLPAGPSFIPTATARPPGFVPSPTPPGFVPSATPSVLPPPTATLGPSATPGGPTATNTPIPPATDTPVPPPTEPPPTATVAPSPTDTPFPPATPTPTSFPPATATPTSLPCQPPCGGTATLEPPVASPTAEPYPTATNEPQPTPKPPPDEVPTITPA